VCGACISISTGEEEEEEEEDARLSKPFVLV